MNTSKKKLYYFATRCMMSLYTRDGMMSRGSCFFSKNELYYMKGKAYSNGGTDYGGNQKDKAVGADL